jgi:hypothetical protein
VGPARDQGSRKEQVVADPNNPVDSLLDLVVFVPVGIAVTVGEQLPRLAAKGRARVEQQLAVARVIGKFAVAKGRQELDRKLLREPAQTGVTPSAPADGRDASGNAVPGGASAERPTAAGTAGGQTLTGPPDLGVPPGSPGEEAPEEPTAPAAVVGGGVGESQEAPGAEAAVSSDRPAPDAQSLAIPGYDSLSASQVVQRLAGLSEDELAAVGSYEAAHRARQTVLTRVSQLQVGRD